MRTMLKVKMQVERSNEALKSGRLPDVIKKTMEKWKPEAAYFFPANGKRTCLMVLDLKDVSQIPSLVEPFFAELNAEVEIFPVMNAEDLMKGLSQLA